MHRDIVIEAFEKAKVEESKENGTEASVVKWAERISDYISNVGKFSYGERSLRNFYRDATGDKGNEVVINKPEVVQVLCQYLGYDSYVEYVVKNPKLKEVTGVDVGPDIKPSHPKKKGHRRILIILLFVGIITIPIVLHFKNKQRWMIWEVNRYVEVAFDADKLQSGDLKLYKQERIEAFRLIPVTCDSIFFETNGSPRIYYGKNTKKDLEYFTDLGLHPETGKALKPLTTYMIDKYICLE
jgi:hypothetical protein